MAFLMLLTLLATPYLGVAADEPVQDETSEVQTILEEDAQEVPESTQEAEGTQTQQEEINGRVEDALAKLRGEKAAGEGETQETIDEDFLLARDFLKVLCAEISLPEGQETVTRGDFLRALASVVNNGMMPEGATGFSDVAADSEYAPYVNYAVKAGIISSGDTFSPEEAVTYAQAFKMAVCALGYDLQAKASGGYPAGYLAVGTQIDLAKGIAAQGQTNLSARDAWKLLYNMLNVDLMRPVQTGTEFVYEARDGETILTEYYGIYNTEGIVDANENTSLLNAAGAAIENTIEIDGNSYFCEDGSDLLGCRVLAYYTELERGDTILFLREEKTSRVELFGEDVVRVSGNTVEYDRNNKLQRYRLAPDFSYIYNGKAKMLTNNQLTDHFKIDGALISLIDNDSDDQYEVVVMDDFVYLHVSNKDELDGYIYDKISSENRLDLSDSQCRYEFYQLEEETWTAAEWDDIKTGALLAAAVSEDGLLAKIYICGQSVSGIVTATDWDSREIYIDGTGYRLHPYFDTVHKKTNETTGETYYAISLNVNYTFLMGLDGRIVLCDMEAVSGSMLYGWFVKKAQTNKVGGQVEVKLFTQSGKMEIYTLASNVMIDGASTSRAEADERLSQVGNSESSYVDRLIKYSVNSEKQINKIDFAEKATVESLDYLDEKNRDPNNSLLRYEFSQPLVYRQYYNNFGLQFNTTGATSFMIPPYGSADAEDDESYSMVPGNHFKNNEVCNNASKLIVYDMNLSGSVGAMVVLGVGTVASGSLIDEEAEQAVVEKVTQCLNEDGELCYGISVWTSAGYDTYYLDLTTQYDVNPQDIHPGDIIRVSRDGKNMVSALAYDFDFQNYKINNNLEVSSRSSLPLLRYLLGVPYNSQGGNLNVFKGSVVDGRYTIGSVALEDMYNVSIPQLVVISARRSLSTGEVISASVRNEPTATIADYKTAGENADVVLMHLRYLDPQKCYVYRVTYEN